MSVKTAKRSKGIWAAFDKKTGELCLANTSKQELLDDMKHDDRYRYVFLKEPKKQPQRVVLGIGHPFFEKMEGRGLIGFQKVMLMEGDCRGEVLTLKVGDLGGYNKIRLLAEVLK